MAIEDLTCDSYSVSVGDVGDGFSTWEGFRDEEVVLVAESEFSVLETVVEEIVY